MPSSRFFEIKAPRSIEDFCALLDVDDLPSEASVLISGLADPWSDCLEHKALYVTEVAGLEALYAKDFGWCLISQDIAASADIDRLRANGSVTPLKDPKAAFIMLAEYFYEERTISLDLSGADPSAHLDVTAQLHQTAIIGAGAKIGARCRVGPYAVLGPGVELGNDVVIEAGATIMHTIMGNGVRLSTGVRIGQAGFGIHAGMNGLQSIPQLGCVRLDDNVEVGANSTIDRGTMGDTVLGAGTRVDNLVQIGHNTILGKNCILAAHTGISGSCTIGDGVLFGGKVGIADHITVGDGARLAASAGVMHDIPAGETWAGSPAKPIRQFMREVATLSKITRNKGKTQ